MRYCSSCSNREGTHHVSVTVDVFSPAGNRRKLVQFWLCPECADASSKLLARDAMQKGRVAQALTTLPARPIPAPGYPVAVRKEVERE